MHGMKMANRIIQGFERTERMICWGRGAWQRKTLGQSREISRKTFSNVSTKKKKLCFMDGHSMTHS